MSLMNFSSNPTWSPSTASTTSVKTFVLPDKCFEKRVACSFRQGNKFCIYPRSQEVSKGPSNTPDNVILDVRQEVLLFMPILRKLVNESNGTFLALMKLSEFSKTSDNQVEYLKLSRQYRSIIRVCIENLQEAANKESDGVKKNSFLSCVTIFYSIECLWHLCEILYIENIPGEIVLPHLLEWVRFHFPCHEQTAAELLEACERGSEDNPAFWDTVVGMVVQGRVDVARALLKLHSSSDSNEFKLVDNSLRSMPTYNVYGGISTGEFTVTWKHWQAECRSKLTSRVLASQPKLELIMKLVTGEYAAFESIRGQYSSWFDLLGGWVMFSAPWARRHELSAAAAACAGMGAPVRSRLDDTVRALLDGDLHQVIHEIQQIPDNGWFATHLTDILHHCGKLKILDKHQNNVTSSLRDALVTEYGALLMGHRSLWQAGLACLAAAAAAAGGGPARARLLLERTPLRSDHQALRVIAEANKYGLDDVARGVCAVMSTRAHTAGRAGAALGWALRGGAALAAAASVAAHGALDAHRRRGALPAADLLLCGGAPLLVAAAPLLLGKYCEFHRLYKNKEFKKAAKLLVSLLTSKLAPDYFWDTLLLDTLPLLEADEPFFSAEDTYEIMLCLELKSSGLTAEQAEMLRLALVRNLTKASLADEHTENQQ